MSLHLQKSAGVASASSSPSAVPPSGAAARIAAMRPKLKTGAIVAACVFLVMFTAERAAPYAWKPSTLIGSLSGNIESASILTAFEAKRAEFAMQKEEEARAQQEVLALQAANERATKAYEAQFSRGSMQAQAWATAAAESLKLDFATKAELLKQGQGSIGNMADYLGLGCDVAKLLDLGTALGMNIPDCGDAARAYGRNHRDRMSSELVANYRKQSAVIAQALNDWKQGLPEPADLMALQAEAMSAAMRSLPRAAVPPSPVYPRAVAPAAAGL